ncbi:MAG TPA: FAD-dependent oxidoreductase [Burkholderiaceae bacterium]|nr:FAD-dependent oxidoreductase [Burkholderiaceae bacterium]
MQRRQMLGTLGTLGTFGTAALAASLAPARAAGIAASASEPTPGTFASPQPPARMRASVDRIVDISVCTRPFRAQGPRIEAQRLHGKTLVHHYGHGGSGWSLSWGSARVALPLVLATRERRIAVIGCGAIGLTTARVAQRAGLRVRIYCKDRPPEVPSSAATGLWSPDSRICTSEYASPAFAQQWEAMARSSFKTYQSLLGLPGEPVQWRDGYVLSDIPFDQPLTNDDGEPEYPDLNARLADLRPKAVPLQPGEHPFRVAHARRFTQMTFNIASYQRMLLEDFLREGGELVQREFARPRELASLPERAIVNCTGFGARALFGDESLVPVRGQTARLVPQPEVDYALIYRGHNLVVVPRRDGLLVAAQGEHDFGNADARIDRATSEAAVARLAALFA